MMQLHGLFLEPIIAEALKEDWGHGDFSSDYAVEKKKMARARIIAKEPLVLAGIHVAEAVFTKVDPALVVIAEKSDGSEVAPSEVVLFIEGNARSILKAERVALNFLGRLSGIAKLAKEYVKELEGSRTQLLDTRKTTPGLRRLEKLAAQIGGARNHRFGLSDGVMLKENHIRAAGGITVAMERLKRRIPMTLKIEVETTNLDEVREALSAGADIIMLDNMSIEMMREAVAIVGGKAQLEASGNIRIDTVKKVAATGVDFVSTSGFITGARWADFSLLFDTKSMP
jgi:nicotinate-nucleotide pyrophosphorylase (carboxylating)